ncbi:peptidoglycan-binding protein [Streptomyces zaomyceticus]|uniref:peptidoglycan-binding domain-containing protein n=1 Tax=Streptomyces zaomyceticus TaxID=68286 RepID=UPI002E137F7C|nr:peptidoglycan-binding protein [Streptomyces zaomyceticus]
MRRAPGTAATLIAALIAALTAGLLAAAPASAADWPLVRKGDSGVQVTTVQHLLTAHGRATGADGVFGAGTEAKVKEFQSASGLTPVDGVVGADTWSKLVVTVRKGDGGSAVKAVQTQLNRYGAGLAVDGAFGDGTDGKVRSFQTSRSLDADGVVGPDTWRALVTGTSGGSGGGLLTHSAAASLFTQAGITWTSSGNCSDRNNRGCTSFDGLRRASADGAVSLRRASSCALTITGGTETGHASGTYSHWNGYKLDFSPTTCLSNHITGTFPRTGTRGDGAALYTAPSGTVFARESNHWDVTFAG